MTKPPLERLGLRKIVFAAQGPGATQNARPQPAKAPKNRRPTTRSGTEKDLVNLGTTRARKVISAEKPPNRRRSPARRPSLADPPELKESDVRAK